MRNIFTLPKTILFLLTFSGLFNVYAQTSWIGGTSTNWSTASNWTSGVPTSATDAVIGDASFTGSFQPLLTATSACKSLTIGNGSIASTLTVAKNITVSGSILIGTNGTITHNAAVTITLKTNWTNSGTYNATVANAGVTFSGTAQTVTGATTYRQATINTGSSVTLANSITVNTGLSVSGTLEPTASYAVAGTGTLTVNSGGTLHVKAADFASNYSLSGTITLNGKSIVNYSSSSINQTVSNTLTYGYLRISGGLVKSLAGNLPSLNSSSNTSGRMMPVHLIFLPIRPIEELLPMEETSLWLQDQSLRLGVLMVSRLTMVRWHLLLPVQLIIMETTKPYWRPPMDIFLLAAPADQL